MYKSQGYKLGMKMGLSDKNALFVKIRRDGSEREVDLLMKKGKANTAFRRGLKSAAADLSKGKRRPAARQKTTRKKTTRQRLTTAKRPAAKRKRTSSSRTSYQEDRSMFKDWNQKETTKWFASLGEKIGNFKSWDDQVYAVIGEPFKLRAAYSGGTYEDPGIVWEITQVKGEPAILQGHDSDTRGYDVVERHTGTLAQMKKKLASISRRKRKNPVDDWYSPGFFTDDATVDGIEVERIREDLDDAKKYGATPRMKGVTKYSLVDFRGSEEAVRKGLLHGMGLEYEGAFAHPVPGGFVLVDGLDIHQFYKRLPTAAQVARLIGKTYSGWDKASGYLIPKQGAIRHPKRVATPAEYKRFV